VIQFKSAPVGRDLDVIRRIPAAEFALIAIENAPCFTRPAA